MAVPPQFDLADRLILFRYFNSLLGAERFEDLQGDLRHQRAGVDADGHSHFFNALRGRAGLRIPETRLAAYDMLIMGDLARLNARRSEPVALLYFQYLAALYTEIFLDQRANRPEAFVNELNAFTGGHNDRLPWGARYRAFTRADLNKLAFWMATGSGKTLLLHLNYYQFLRYHPEPGDNILLVTPNEALSAQHLAELHLSGIPARGFRESSALAGQPRILRVIEITKITTNKTGRGVSADVESFGDHNLLFVDEGHKGQGGEAWKTLRDRMGANGFTFEYSATFGQAIDAVRDPDLLEEYSKAILFDYSYKYFYGDGYGKDYQVINLREDHYDTAPGAGSLTDTFLLANLLAFYEQARLYAQEIGDLYPYNLEPPLWIFIGSSVNAVQTENGRKTSDVLRVALFLERVLANQDDWTIRTLDELLQGRAELNDAAGSDLFAGRFPSLRRAGLSAAQLYPGILRTFFRVEASGHLRLCEIKNGDGEIGLKAGASEQYFGLINIGDVAAFLKLVDAEPALNREADSFSPSLFEAVNTPDSSIQILIGSKKFIEGWSSWRVTSMGLLNIGRSEGSQIIQLFGRGVRLLGKERSLKRSDYLVGPHPADLRLLETLNIFGVRANYMAQFRDYLRREGVPSGGIHEVEVPIQPVQAFLQEGLMAPRLKAGANFSDAQFISLPADLLPAPTIDLRPQFVVLTGQSASAAQGQDVPRQFRPEVLNLLDWDRLRLDLLAFKSEQGWHNLVVARDVMRAIFDRGQFTLYAAEADVLPKSYAGLEKVQSTVLTVLKRYTEVFYQRARSRWESRQMEYRQLDLFDENLSFGAYRLQIPVEQQTFIRQVESLVHDMARLLQREDNDLPRLYFDRHLYLPLLVEKDQVSITPPGLDAHERLFVERLRSWVSKKPPELAGKSLFLLRNLSRGRGIGFFEDAGFYPDFILWIKQGVQQRVIFIDPHGMLLNSAPGDGKIQLHRLIKDIEQTLANPAITLESYILSTTSFANLSASAAWRGYDRQRFASLHLLFEDGELKDLLG